MTLRVGQIWRQDDDYLCRIVGIREDGWPWVRHANNRGAAWLVNPAWFAHWSLSRDVES